jgi:flagellar hook-associated protein 3 FlgL
MIIPPYAFGRYSSDVNTSRLVQLKQDAEDVGRQLSTGLRADTYSGLGSELGASLDLNGRLSLLDGYQSIVSDVALRAKLMDQSLQSLSDSVTATARDIPAGFVPTSDGRTDRQHAAEQVLGSAIDLLNQNVNGRYLFSGRSSDTKPVQVSLDTLINGDGARAGLKQLINERAAADLGTDGMGRLTLTSGGGSVTLAETAGAGPFGLKVAGVSGALGGATISAPPTTPGTAGINFASGLPAPGDAITISFNLPDGTTASIAMTARANASDPMNASDFVIGPDAATTASNFATALQGAVQRVAGGALAAASAVATATNFFSASKANPPQRVSGSPGSALVAGTAANTVIWYSGDDTSAPRDAAQARVDETEAVKLGAQANEPGIVRALASLGAFAVSVMSGSPDVKADRYQELSSRFQSSTATTQDGTPSIQAIQVEIGMANAQAAAAGDRHKSTKAVLNGALGDIQNTSTEQAAAQLLSIQTTLQASYQATAMIAKLRLTDYL